MDVLEIDAATPITAGYRGRSRTEQRRAPVAELATAAQGSVAAESIQIVEP